MTLRQLEVFLAVAREKSFSLAAKKIHSSQPTLSEHISELESELGKQLFFRRGRRRVVAVTEAGRVFENLRSAPSRRSRARGKRSPTWMAWLTGRS
jgi:DNA-binding transcriptional LysR family regulator